MVMSTPILILVSVLSILLVMYGIFTYVRIQNLIRVSSGLVESTKPFERSASTSAPKVLFVGDSVSLGVGASKPEKSITGLFSEQHPEWSVDSLSVSGRRTAGLIPVFQALSDKSYDMVVIQIGGNDVVHFTPQEDLESQIDAVLTEAKRVSSHVVLLTSGNVGDAPLFPRPFAWMWSRKTLEVRELFMAEAEKNGVVYVDLYRKHDEDPFALHPYEYHTTDLFHPSDLGYAFWHDALEKKLLETDFLK